mgnify:CR=1 FL=1
MKTYTEKAREIPVAAEVDVLVAGGGPAGFAAAYTAAKNGVSVLLLEQGGDVGGMSTIGLMSHWVGRADSKLYHEILRRSADRNPGAYQGVQTRLINTEELKTLYLEMLEEVHARLMLYTFVSDVITDNGAVTGLIVENKAGRQAILAKTVVDATGDGDVAARAGAEFQLGRENDQKMQPMTLMFKVGGVDVRDYHMDSLRNQVAVVLQKNVLFSGTILENLRWGNKEASEKECRRACQLSCADDFIEKMPDKYNTYIEQGGTNVSGGQKQRLCIARALLKKPKVLILDDSTSAVDTATDARIRRAFAEEIPDTTKLIIAQRISSIQSADRIIVMDEGKISGFGTHEELMKTNAIYQEVYNSQIKGGGDFDENRGGEQA